MTLVIDASVAMKWFLGSRPDEPNVDAALDIFNGYISGRYALLQPPHFKTEVCAVITRESPATMVDTLRDLTDLALPMRDDLAIYARAMQLSHDLSHHLFDTLYHAVALETADAELITADDTYFRKAKGLGRIRLLADWQRAHWAPTPFTNRVRVRPFPTPLAPSQSPSATWNAGLPPRCCCHAPCLKNRTAATSTAGRTGRIWQLRQYGV